MAWGLPKISSNFSALGGNLTAEEPAGIAEGDLMICSIAYRDSAPFTLPTGGEWAWAVTQQSSGNTSTTASTAIASGAMAWCRRGASAPNLVFTRTGGDIAHGKILAYSGGLTAGDMLIAGSANTLASNDGNPTVAGLDTTGFADALLYVVFAGADNITGANFSISAATDPTTASGATPDTTNAPSGQWRLRFDEITGTGADTAHDAADAVKATPGSTGLITASTVGVTSRHVMMAAAFKIASSGTTAEGTGTAAGAGDAAGVGQSVFPGTGTAAGTGDAAGVGQQVLPGMGTAAGTGSAAGVGQSVFPGTGTAAGTGDASGTSQAIHEGIGTAAGAGDALGIAPATDSPTVGGSTIFEAPIIIPPTVVVTDDTIITLREPEESVGTAAGIGDALGVGQVIHIGVGTAAGAGAAAGVGDTFNRAALTTIEANDGIVATARLALQAVLTQTEASDTSVIRAGLTPAAAVLAAIEENDVLTAAGASSYKGVLSQAEIADVLAATAALSGTAQLAVIEHHDLLAATGVLPLAAFLATTESSDTLLAGVANRLSALLGVTEDDDIVSATTIPPGIDIPGATSGTYTPVATDVGRIITVRITATNIHGVDVETTAGILITSDFTVPVVSEYSISGTGRVGETITSTYVLAGNPAPAVALQWNKNGVAISGATATTYTPVIGDLGATITLTITATNTQGSDIKITNGIGVISAQTGPIISGHSITGTARVGDLLTAVYSITGNPSPTVSFQWKKNNTNIIGATSGSYTPVTGDLGATITVTINAVNIISSDSKTTAGVVITAPLAAPVISGYSISGTGFVGEVLTAVYTITGNPVPTTGLQWKKNGVNISGATGGTYTPVAGDAGTSITLTITSTNTQGSDVKTTAGVSILATVVPNVVFASGESVSVDTTNIALPITGATAGMTFVFFASRAANLPFNTPPTGCILRGYLQRVSNQAGANYTVGVWTKTISAGEATAGQIVVPSLSQNQFVFGLVVDNAVTFEYSLTPMSDTTSATSGFQRSTGQNANSIPSVSMTATGKPALALNVLTRGGGLRTVNEPSSWTKEADTDVAAAAVSRNCMSLASKQVAISVATGVANWTIDGAADLRLTSWTILVKS